MLTNIVTQNVQAAPSGNWTVAIAWANGAKFFVGMRVIPVAYRRRRTVKNVLAVAHQPGWVV